LGIASLQEKTRCLLLLLISLMELLYYTCIKLYALAIHLVSPFNGKARDWVKGRVRWKKEVASQLKPNEKRILFHCASLGEFEQGKPVLEAIKLNFPDYKIVLTFFSPSGFNVRKNDPLADYVFYLPADGPYNSKLFIKLINPSLAFFVKYEFWHYYIKALKDRQIPIYIVSSIFRPSQIFFKPWGGFFHKILKRVSHIFVQNQESLELLYNSNIAHVSVTGDTRFDRVYHSSLLARNLPEFDQFKGDKMLLVAGSTWPADEKVLYELFLKQSDSFKFIIAPHEAGETNIKRIEKMFGGTAVRYSQWKQNPFETSVLIINNVGMLSSIYRYGDAAFIGGGFGSGIHNILEAAVFGIPVFFGPKFKKFREAKELIHWKGAFSVKNDKELIAVFDTVMNDSEKLKKIREVNTRYIQNNKGSTELIIEHLKINHPKLNDK
jgi:3-deoxy-D-manno-octulosonic-acid transferase